jgi:hypothetical protein
MFEMQASGPLARPGERRQPSGARPLGQIEWPTVPPDRYRCATCGNLTRFDVTVTRRTRAFHHYTLGGELVVEDEEVLSERVEEVTCRWCGPAGTIEALAPAQGSES